ncbi:MAG: carbohydrate kinase family protein [Candidatus Thorarchaeota archaeon]
MKSPSTIDLLGIGISPVDFFVSIDTYPAPGRKINGIPGSTLIAGGGPVPTALCTFANMGGSASLITSIGDDHWGDFIRSELDRFGVQHDHVVVRKRCSTALASAWINIHTGERTIVLDMSPRMHIRPRDIHLSNLPRPKLVQVDGRHVEADIKLARWARRMGARILLDIGSDRNPVDDIFPHIDFLVCADEYAFARCKTRSIDTAVNKFKKMGIPEVVVTAGTKGSFGIDVDGRTAYQKAYRVKAVDTTGAGDVYHGAFLYGVHWNWDLATRMRFASAAAALKCREPGARAGIPTLRQTLNFMRKHRRYYA